MAQPPPPNYYQPPPQGPPAGYNNNAYNQPPQAPQMYDNRQMGPPPMAMNQAPSCNIHVKPKNFSFGNCDIVDAATEQILFRGEGKMMSSQVHLYDPSGQQVANLQHTRNQCGGASVFTYPGGSTTIRKHFGCCDTLQFIVESTHGNYEIHLEGACNRNQLRGINMADGRQVFNMYRVFKIGKDSIKMTGEYPFLPLESAAISMVVLSYLTAK